MANNIFNLMKTGNWSPSTITAESLRDLLGEDKVNRFVSFPPGIGGYPDVNKNSSNIPFVIFAPYNRPSGTRGIGSTRVIDELPPPSFAIALPLPVSALKTDYSVTYAEVEMGAELELIADKFTNNDLNTFLNLAEKPESIAAAAGVGITGAIAKFFTDKNATTSDLVKAGLSRAAIASLEGPAATAAAGIATIKNMLNQNLNENMTNLIFSSSGLSENPFTEQIFKNVNRRSFIFNYTFMPKNYYEAELVDRIIQLFKFYMLPAYASMNANKFSEEVTQQLNEAGIFYSYPYEFQIIYSVQDTTFTLLPSVLTKMDVAHNPGMDSPKFFVKTNNKEYPIKTTVSLTFTEVMLLTRDKVLLNDADERPVRDFDYKSRNIDSEFAQTWSKTRFRF